MEFKYNVTGSDRKRLVTAMAERLKCTAKYKGAPTFAYEVDYFTIDKNGIVSFDDRADSEEIEKLIERLHEQGFETEPGFEDLRITEEAELGLVRQRHDPVGEDGMQASDVPDEDIGLVIEICGDCGEYYGSKVWHSNSKYRRTIWQCNGKFKGVEKCRTPHLYEDDIKAMFLKAVSELMIDREALIDDGRVLHTAFTDFNAIDKEVAEITSEIDVLSGLVQKLVDENASTTLDQTEYRSRYDGYIDRYDKAKKRLAALQEQRQLQELKGDILSGFLFELGELYDLPMVFKDETWNALVDHVTVHKGGRVVFTFKNGTEVTEML